jgi:dehydrogenase/reductase SDR family protein 7B
LGRLVLITGASSGIGRATAVEFIRAGDRVVAVARDAARLEALRDTLEAGSNLTPIVADVTDPVAVDAMAQRVQSEIGIPDVVVANAGIGLDALFTETRDDALRAVFEVNVFGCVRTVRPFVTPMIERGSGRILLISSIVGKRGTPHYAAYSASKFALHGLADALRVELLGSGVSVGLICPSSTTTEFQQHLLREGPAQNRVRPRRHSPESVARAIVKMADSRRREIVLGFEAKLLCVADAIAPGLVDRILARALIRPSDSDQA